MVEGVDSWEGLKRRGTERFASGEWEEAAKLYTEACGQLASKPLAEASDQVGTLLCNISLCYARQKKWDASAKAAREALRHSRSVKALYRLGVALASSEGLREPTAESLRTDQLSLELDEVLARRRGAGGVEEQCQQKREARRALLQALSMQVEQVGNEAAATDGMCKGISRILRKTEAALVQCYYSSLLRGMPVAVELHRAEANITYLRWITQLVAARQQFGHGHEGLGKGVYARRATKPGMPCFEEVPLAWEHDIELSPAREVMNSYSTTCAHCMRRQVDWTKWAQWKASQQTFGSGKACRAMAMAGRTLQSTTVYCPECVDPNYGSYCSESCRSSAWGQYHRYLCTRTLPTSHGIAGLRSLCCAAGKTNPLLAAKLIAILLSSSGRAPSFGGTGPDLGDFEMFVFEQKPIEGEERMVELLRQQFCSAPGLTGETVERLVTVDILRRLCGSIQQNAQRLAPVSELQYCIVTTQPELQPHLEALCQADGTRLEDEFALLCSGNEASSMLFIGNCMNHSCAPNVFAACGSPDARIQFIAMSPIAAGVELSRSYIDESLPQAARAATLARRYGFHCQCPICLRNAYV